MINPSGTKSQQAEQKATKAKIIAMDFITFHERILMVPAQIIQFGSAWILVARVRFDFGLSTS